MKISYYHAFKICTFSKLIIRCKLTQMHFDDDKKNSETDEKKIKILLLDKKSLCYLRHLWSTYKKENIIQQEATKQEWTINRHVNEATLDRIRRKRRKKIIRDASEWSKKEKFSSFFFCDRLEEIGEECEWVKGSTITTTSTRKATKQKQSKKKSKVNRRRIYQERKKIEENFFFLRCAMWIWWMREREMEESREKKLLLILLLPFFVSFFIAVGWLYAFYILFSFFFS